MRGISIAFVCLFFGTGCATIMTGGGHTQSVRFNSEPKGAMVYVDGNKIGMTPIAASLTRGDDHKVRLEMEGYATQEQLLKHGPNLWTFGNLIIGGLIGIAVDAVSGSWEGVLNPNDVRVTMLKIREYDAAAQPRYRDDPVPVYRAPQPWEVGQ